MARDAQKAAGNMWYDARMRAAKWNEKLSSREGVEAELGISVDSLRRIENKVIPVDSACLLADLYNAPELLNHYCNSECPIGRRRMLSEDSLEIDRVTVRIIKRLRIEDIRMVRRKLVDIADDGKIGDDEVEDLLEVREFFRELQRTASELEIICEKAVKGRIEDGVSG